MIESEHDWNLDSNSECFDYKTGEENNNSKKRRIEQLELETSIQNSINGCSMDVNSIYETGLKIVFDNSEGENVIFDNLCSPYPHFPQRPRR